ncbi:hypothetical protein A5814_002258 [Enterococcus faecium]|nr:hypothetical protein A5814_002258 [Enterococcus faecium]
MKLIRKIKKYLFCRHVFYCSDCKFTLRINAKELEYARPWGGPYCPKCGEKIQKK